MKKPKTQFCFRVWDKLVKKWCAGGSRYSKDGKLYSRTNHARAAITNRTNGHGNRRKKEEYELKFYKLVEITEEQYNQIRAEEHERKNS